MKAFVLAAGHGTRLRPITDSIPKCLVPIQGVPLLEIWLEVCRRAAVDEVLVNLHAHADAVRSRLHQHANGMKVRLVEESVLLGSAGTLLANRDWVAGEDCFWILYADVLTNIDLNAMLAFHRSRSSLATIGVYRVEDPSRCGVVTFDDDFVVREFEEKPAHPKSSWAFTGVMVASPQLLNLIPDRSPVDLGFDILPRLTGRTTAYPVREYLLDIGTLENYHLAQRTWQGFSSGPAGQPPVDVHGKVTATR
ncbi:MAG TPA: nucleotidyltransferase family protein [Terriglobales bacterium]